MANIWQIYMNDWRNLFKVPVAVLLILFGLLALLLALTLQKPLAPFIRKSAEQAEKSKLIS
ncbi:hypothetical protein D3C74_393540 [compost metagenome]